MRAWGTSTAGRGAAVAAMALEGRQELEDDGAENRRWGGAGPWAAPFGDGRQEERRGRGGGRPHERDEAQAVLGIEGIEGIGWAALGIEGIGRREGRRATSAALLWRRIEGIGWVASKRIRREKPGVG